MAPSNEVTRLLLAWSHGDEIAFEKLVPLVYDELHRLARKYMGRERAGHVLQTTALINILKDTAIAGFALHIAASAYHQHIQMEHDD